MRRRWIILGCLLGIWGCKDPKTDPNVAKSKEAPPTLTLSGGETPQDLTTTPEGVQPDGSKVTKTTDPVTGATVVTIEAPPTHQGGTENTRTGPGDPRTTKPVAGIGTTTNICTADGVCAPGDKPQAVGRTTNVCDGTRSCPPSLGDFPTGMELAAPTGCQGLACASFFFEFTRAGGDRVSIDYVGPETVKLVLDSGILQAKVEAKSDQGPESYALQYDTRASALTFAGNLSDQETKGQIVPLTFKYEEAACDLKKETPAGSDGYFLVFNCGGARDFAGALYVPAEKHFASAGR